MTDVLAPPTYSLPVTRPRAATASRYARETEIGRKRRARKMARVLAETHPDAHCELDFTNPLELAVATPPLTGSRPRRQAFGKPGRDDLGEERLPVLGRHPFAGLRSGNRGAEEERLLDRGMFTGATGRRAARRTGRKRGDGDHRDERDGSCERRDETGGATGRDEHGGEA